MSEVLVLPLGGSAQRMLGLPKFLLPINQNQTLLSSHITAGEFAGYDRIVLIVNNLFSTLVENYVSKLNIDVEIVTLQNNTKSMCETLKIGLESVKMEEDAALSIGLADTVFHGTEMRFVYSKLKKSESDFCLMLFDIRSDQLGKLGQVQINGDKVVTQMQDKVVGCSFSKLWGLAKVPRSYIEWIDPADAHIGISLERSLNSGLKISTEVSNASYFDCGTFDEYLLYLKLLK